MFSRSGSLNKAFTTPGTRMLKTKSTSGTSITRGLSPLRLPHVYFPPFIPSVVPSTVTPRLFCLVSSLLLTPASVRLVHCFISAPGPSSLAPPWAPGGSAFPGRRAPASPAPPAAAAAAVGSGPPGIARQDAGGEALSRSETKPENSREAGSPPAAARLGPHSPFLARPACQDWGPS